MQAPALDFSSVVPVAALFDTSNMVKTPDNPPVMAQLMRFKPEGWSPNRWAVEAGVSRTVWADIRKHGNPSRRTLERLLGVAGSTVAEFEALRTDLPVRSEVASAGMSASDLQRAWQGSGLVNPVPLLGSALGSTWFGDEESIELLELCLSEVLDYLTRPPSVATDPEAYAVTVVGESMSPRFESGERAYVSPKSPVSIGDDVIVQLVGDGEEDDADRVVMVLIKRLVRRTAKEIELRQFNPDTTFRVPIERVARIHKVVGRL